MKPAPVSLWASMMHIMLTESTRTNTAVAECSCIFTVSFDILHHIYREITLFCRIVGSFIALRFGHSQVSV